MQNYYSICEIKANFPLISFILSTDAFLRHSNESHGEACVCASAPLFFLLKKKQLMHTMHPTEEEKKRRRRRRTRRRKRRRKRRRRRKMKKRSEMSICR